MITIEEGAVRPGAVCDECGAATWSARGFAYSDHDAHAVYLASWADCAPNFVKLAVIVGEWGEGADSSSRRRVGMDVDYSRDPPSVTVVDPTESPWDVPSDLSPPMLGRQEALALPELEEIFHVVDHVVVEDSRISRFLSS